MERTVGVAPSGSSERTALIGRSLSTMRHRWPRIVFGTLCGVLAAAVPVGTAAAGGARLASAAGVPGLAAAVYSAFDGGKSDWRDNSVADAALAQTKLGELSLSQRGFGGARAVSRPRRVRIARSNGHSTAASPDRICACLCEMTGCNQTSRIGAAKPSTGSRSIAGIGPRRPNRTPRLLARFGEQRYLQGFSRGDRI
jgi:hypothetical protein